ncbi:hypothetical protein [Methylobacillus glycogenes]|uniref:hypothetical protein n=1 Tax=Methylobacillus glycogenes TaxID=406 RepID=UPI000471CC8E|nr:hypothetical protein [Methylobacillus glycogenes]
MFLLDYQAELSAKRTLETLREELALNIRSAKSFEAAAIACEQLCLIARAPNHYLGLELIKVLDHPDKHLSSDISAMILAFIKRIQIQIDHERAIDPSGNQYKMMLN